MRFLELAEAELNLLANIEALFNPAEEGEAPVDDPGAEAAALVDQYLERLAEVQGQLGPKIESYIRIILHKKALAAMAETEAAICKSELQRLNARVRDLEDDAAFYEDRLKAFLDRRNLTKLEAGTRTIKIVNQGGKLPVIFDPAIQPSMVDGYWKEEVPASWKFNREAIEKALKAGQQLFTTVKDPVTGQDVKVEWAKYGPRPTVLKIS